MLYRNRKLSLISAAVIAALTAAQAGAQEAQLEEIVVTARQRAERIEDVPVTITAFTANEIKAAGIERPQDFIALTSGVSAVQTAEAGDMQVNIRGINTGRDAETNFALVIDGVLQTNPNALNQELAGVSQIEILKGPQGALYGRNAVAGAMIITTRKPGDAAAFDVSGGYGSDNSYKASVYAGGPIGDGMKGSISAYTRKTDGQWENLDRNCDDCVDFYEETGVQGRMLFDVGGGEVDIKAKYSKIDAGAINFNASIALSDAAAGLNAPAFYEDPNKHNFRYLNNILPQNEQENVNLSIKGEWEVGVGTLTSYVAYNDQTNYFLTDGTSAAFLLYALNPTCRSSNDAKLSKPGYEAPFFGIPSSIWLTPAGNNGAGFTPPYGPSTCDGYQYQQRDQKDASIELRLTSPGDEDVRWVAGIYAADIKRRVVVSQGSDLNKGLTATAFVPASGLNPTDLLYDDDFKSNVYAAFGQLAFDVTDQLELALALRYDSEDRAVDNNVPRCTTTDTASCRAQTPDFSFFSKPFINPAYTVTPAFATTGIPSRSTTFSQLQPKFSANWKANDDFAVYASYGYGFRSGGFNSSGSAATVNTNYGRAGGTVLCLGSSFLPPTCGANAVLNITDVNDTYRKEVSKAAEVGFKSFFLDRRLSLNAAVYHTKVEDMQFFNFFAGPFGLLRVVTNIDEVTIKGFELDGRWRVNNNVSVFAAYSTTDGNIDKYVGRPYTAGGEVPYAPKYTGNAGVDFELPFGGSDWVVNARVDASFVGETWFHPVQKQRLPNLFTYFQFGQGTFDKMSRDAYYSVNARVGVSNGKFGVTAWGRNITDENYLQEIIPAPEFGGSFIHDSPGAAYGIDFTYSFR
jgi:iron complex outermembrane receptor protein